jgi:hypothetical protein
MEKILFVLFCVAGFSLAACDGQSGKPYMKIVGGGFVFNYRYSAMNYGFVAKPLRPLPAGGTLEASFEVPDSDQKYVTTLPVQEGKMQYVFETKPLLNVKKDKPYKAKLRLLEAGSGKELALLEQEFRSTADQSTLPTKAPVKGIGYFPNPQ